MANRPEAKRPYFQKMARMVPGRSANGFLSGHCHSYGLFLLWCSSLGFCGSDPESRGRRERGPGRKVSRLPWLVAASLRP
jgi:hypothetical protein